MITAFSGLSALNIVVQCVVLSQHCAKTRISKMAGWRPLQVLLTFLTLTCLLTAGQEVDDVMINLDDLTQQLKTLEENGTAANKKIAELQAKVADYEAKLQKLQAEMTSSQTSCDVTIAQLNDTLSLCLVDKTELNINISHLNDDVFRQSSYNDNIEHELEDCKLLLTETEIALEQITSESLQCTSNLENTENSIELLNIKYEKCNNDTNALKYEYRTLENSHNQSSLEFGDVQFQLLEINNNVIANKIDLENCKNELEILNNKSVVLEYTNNKLLELQSNCSNELKLILEDNTNCIVSIDSCTEKLEEIKLNLNGSEQLKSQLEDCMLNLRKNDEEKENIDNNQTNLLSKCELDKVNAIEEMKNLKFNYTNEKNKSIKELQSQITSCSRENENKIAKINAVGRDFSQCKNDKLVLNSEIGILMEKKDTCNKELNVVKSNLIASQNNLNSCNEKFTNCEGEKYNYINTISLLQNENRKCKNDVLQLNTGVQHANARFGSCNFDLQGLRSQLSSVQSKFSDCQTANSNCERDKRWANYRIEGLEEDLRKRDKTFCERVKSEARSVKNFAQKLFG